jgi:glycosyltransferase involved in cell wall biosynthesis
MTRPKITFRSPPLDMSGYSTMCRNIILELHKMDVCDIVLESLGWVNSRMVPLGEKAQILYEYEKIGRSDDYWKNRKEYTIIHASVGPELEYSKDYKKYIGLTMLETDTIPKKWVDNCNKLDAVIVPSNAALASFLCSGVNVPVKIVPLGVDFETFSPNTPPLYSKEDISTKYNFLTVGQWPGSLDRKNIEKTIEIFLTAFKGNADVGLMAKVYWTGAGTLDKIGMIERIRFIKNKLEFKPDEPPFIYLIHGAASSEMLASIYTSADCFILPSMGESWGIPIIEAAACGLPIITTGGTGPDTYLNPEYSLLLNFTLESVPRRLWCRDIYEPKQRFTQPKWGEFVEALPKYYAEKEKIKEMALLQRQELIDRDFTWKKCAENILEVVNSVENK